MALQDPALASAFREYDRNARVRYSKAVTVFVAVLVPAGVSLDYFVYPELAIDFLIVRLAVAALALLLLALHYTRLGTQHIFKLSLTPPLLTNAAIAWMIYRSQEAASPYYAGLNLAIFGIGVLLPLKLSEALIFTGGTLVAYMAASFEDVARGTDWSAFYNNVYFLVLTSLICCTSAFMKTRAREAEFELQTRLARTNAELTRMERAKSQFFANISHELRTPLTLILSPLEESLSNAQSGSKPDQLLHVAYRNALRLLKLINELLEFVRLDAAESTRRAEPVELGEFLRSQAESLEHLANLQALSLDVRTMQEEVWVKADRNHLEKIVSNLLTNAIKYTPNGGRVALTLKHTPGYAVIEVVDTGIGISEQDLEIIFDRFRQAENSTRMQAGGMGIGLALAKELAEENDGKLTARSRLDHGTTMILELPLIDPPAAAEQSDQASSDPISKFSRKAEREFFPEPSRTTNCNHDADTPLVLVVDDEHDMRYLMASSLDEDYGVLESDDGEEALLAIERDRPDVVVLDYMMPGMDGLAVSSAIAQRPDSERPRVLMLTARDDDETKLQALAHGADDFLTKPFSVPELRLRIDNLLRARRLERELREQNIQLEQTLRQLKEAETKLVQSEKFSALGRMAGGLLHELNNPLNYANAAITLARENVPESEPMLREIIADVHEGLGRVQAVIGEVRSFANPAASVRREVVSLARIAQQAVTLAKPELNGVDVRIDVPDGLSVSGAEVQLMHVLSNMLSNAGDAIRRSRVGGVIKISAYAAGDRAQVEVSDDGPGIASEVLDTVLDPFVTTKPPGEGTGLGLAICDRFVKNHGGAIIIQSRPNAGTSMSFDLPIARPRSGAS